MGTPASVQGFCQGTVPASKSSIMRFVTNSYTSSFADEVFCESMILNFNCERIISFSVLKSVYGDKGGEFAYDANTVESKKYNLTLLRKLQKYIL
jgi:hypothetical protein